MNDIYIPYVLSCACPNCNKNILFKKESFQYVAKCKDCSIEIHKMFFTCCIMVNNYSIFFSKNNFRIENNKRNIIYNSTLEGEFDWNKISEYYKTSLKIINNLIFL